MKIGVVVVMFVLISSMALGYCNETITYQDAQNYSVTKTCTADYNNQSFLALNNPRQFFGSSYLFYIY